MRDWVYYIAQTAMLYEIVGYNSFKWQVLSFYQCSVSAVQFMYKT